jgi:putative MATE family efflux protein
MTSQHPYLTASIGTSLLRLATPNITAMSFMLIAAVIEAWFVSHIGTVALAGLALAFPMFMLMIMLSAGAFGGAITGSIAQRLGANNRNEAEALALNGLVLSLVLSTVSTGVFLGAGPLIYSFLGGRGAVLEQTLAYSDSLFWGCTSIWIANTLAGITRATGNMWTASINLVTGSFVQVFVSAVLIFGIGPFPEMGISGAAIGVVAGYLFASLLLIRYLMAHCPELKLKFTSAKIRLVSILIIFKVGILSSLNPVCSVASVIAMTSFMTQFGVETLAGFGIGARLEFLMIPMIFGFGTASTVMIGVNFGANQIKRAYRIGWTASLFSALLVGSIGALFAIFPELWIDLFTNEAGVQQAATSYLRIVGPFYFLFGLALCLYFASQGAGRVLWPVLGVVFRFIIILCGGLLLIGYNFTELEHFYYLIVAGFIAQTITSASSVYFGAWTKGDKARN